MTDQAVLDQCVRRYLPQIRRSLAHDVIGGTVWIEGHGFITIELIRLIAIAYRNTVEGRYVDAAGGLLQSAEVAGH